MAMCTWQLVVDKKLGAGMFGTTYLVRDKENSNKMYALKMQRIEKAVVEQKKKYAQFDIWRELDIFNIVNNLSVEQSRFFVTLIHFEISTKIKHVQQRSRRCIGARSNTFHCQIQKIDASPYCGLLLMPYLGTVTLYAWLTSNKPKSKKHTYALMLQICNIVKILWNKGYAHNDLHTKNIMVTSTPHASFKINNVSIPTYGQQLVVIDYGGALKRNFDDKNVVNLWTKRPSLWVLDEMMQASLNVSTNNICQIEDMIQKRKKLPWDRKNTCVVVNTVKHILTTNNKWLHKTLDELKQVFIDIRAETNERLILAFLENDNNYEVCSNIRTQKSSLLSVKETEISLLFLRVTIEYQTVFTKQYDLKYGWETKSVFYASCKTIRRLLRARNTQEYIQMLIENFI